ncbi:LacI family DNA-binding transcriptional regulator [Empedobacter falsenii]|uniref:LacI family DNA-binding transcriptional regulator n=1 Tax=Empedobacter TaxID=59734 RepID=UPI000E9833F2|nr:MULTISPECIES: LacI family DNA-binding transcriptional regulator [Empedobacter]MDM1299153.1 LacI family DNA-binding transcriptional regulator [Empedobacter falsenii]MDM1318912.1 LacI family DNA-binding transcriptional regulator [Empedobacter falsenii]MDM1547614.1 LacI family DNA-binding transcriptional regulator [Empedobacter falsenii]HAR72202.1 LacI family transcriptional regulator [Flavobacteriaceae bacterium]
MKKNLTLKQIAKELDVSISTVSKALKNSEEISAATKQKIQAFAKLYNYKPNNIALSLKNRKTKTIAVIIPEIVHDFFAMVISGIENLANQYGYNVLICLSNESYEREVINMEMLAAGSIDGFVISLSKETQAKKDYHHIKEIINQGMPVVMFDRVTREVYTDKVIIDDVLATQEAIQYFISKGRKKIGFITTPDYISVGRLRTEGYKRTLEANGIEVDENLILRVEDESQLDTMIDEFFEKNKFDAVMAVNELYAVKVLRAALKKGIKVPEELHLIAFTDGVISKNSIPSISTVKQNAFKMGEIAARLLIQKLESENEHEHYITEVVGTELLHRETTTI